VAGKNPKVDEILRREERWPDEMAELRAIALSCGLSEEVKWGQACYCLDGRNVVLVHGFKEYCAFLLFKGALLEDPDGILVRQTENVQAARQIRFGSVVEIVRRKAALKRYVLRAIELEKSGTKAEFKKVEEFAVPDEFRRALEGSAALRKAFDALTPGRRRMYLSHFGGAKQASTREARVAKHVPRILQGLGLDD
jgi:uncharacterized protein YdeI (YjbR/CyaY-like superfamily)